MHVLGIKRLLRRRDHASAVEASLIMLHAALYLTVVLWVLSPLKALAFVAVQQAVFSLYLGISFAPNHKGMPIIESATRPFARRQVVTARNIRGGRSTTFMLGGLNYQIEHHLFPSMPRPNLRRVQGLVRDFCTATDLGYCEESFVESFRQIVHHLSDLEQPPAAALTDYCVREGQRARSSAVRVTRAAAQSRSFRWVVWESRVSISKACPGGAVLLGDEDAAALAASRRRQSQDPSFCPPEPRNGYLAVG